MGKKIYVTNISKATEQDIRDLFSDYGEVISVKVRQTKGFGFVEMGSENDAKKAISGLNGKPFMGKPLTVAEAIPHQPRADFHGGKGGFGKDKSFKKAW
jgi:RNA recognition motif-containing protein